MSLKDLIDTKYKVLRIGMRCEFDYMKWKHLNLTKTNKIKIKPFKNGNINKYNTKI